MLDRSITERAWGCPDCARVTGVTKKVSGVLRWSKVLLVCVCIACEHG